MKCRVEGCNGRGDEFWYGFCRACWNALPAEPASRLCVADVAQKCAWSAHESSEATRDAVHEYQVALDAACEALKVTT